MKIIKTPIIKIAVIILSCICLTSCSGEKINDAKKEAKKIPRSITHNEKDAKRVEKDFKKIGKEVKNMPGYIVHDIKNSKIKYSKKDAKKDAKKIARYVANGEKAKFIKEMAKNVMKKKGSMEKVNELFSYMDGANIKTRYVDNTPIPSRDFNQYFYEFHNEKNHYYYFLFDFVPVDINDAGNTGIKGFYMVEIEGWRKDGSLSLRAIRKPVKLYRHPSEARLAKEHAAIWK